MSQTVTLEEVENWVQWDESVEKSRQGTLFHQHRFLRHTGVQYRAWWIKKGAQVCGGIVVQEGSEEKTAKLDDLVIHNGIWFSPTAGRRLTKARSDEFAITEAVISHLVDRYNQIELALAPEFTDLRPFLWHNYGVRDGGQFKLSLRYTSCQNIEELSTHKDLEDYVLFQQMSTLRQRNLREAFRHDVVCQPSDYFDELLDDYRMTVGLSESEFSCKRIRMLRLMHRLQADNFGQLFSVISQSGEILYQVFFAWDQKRAYYLFGAGNTRDKKRFQGTAAFWSAMRALARSGVKWIDWEGVNSPKRGQFKLSFGGELVPYCELRWP